MVYKALYRKYRPKDFNEVAGQKFIVQILKNSIINSKMSHAYLFYGPRGTGKTSIAKIFAKSINCENNNNGISCNICDKCKEFDNGSVDIIEIDAASNNGVDEIRELKSKVNLVPSFMKYKVYIIDEVHMLSIGAFNALLKTLEEPPEHVIFILATTELNKVPNTIVSRCQLMEFKRITDDEMREVLKNVSEKEKICINDEAIAEIIKYADGGLRDSLGLLDKISLYSMDDIDSDDVRLVCGNATLEDIDNILTYIKDKESKLLVEKVDELYSKGVNLVNVGNDMILSLQEKLLVDYDKEICNMIMSLNDLVEKIKKSSLPKIIFEVGLINMINSNNSGNISREIILGENNQQYIEKRSLFSEKSEKTNEKVSVSKKVESDFSDMKRIRINNSFVSADKEILKDIKKDWDNLNNYIFDSEYGAVASLLIDSIPIVASDEYLVLMFEYDSLELKANEDYLIIQKFLLQKLNKKYKVVSITKVEWEKYKEEYIKNIKSGYKYVYINDDFENKKNSKENKTSESDMLTSLSEDLFGQENIILK